MTLLLQGYGVQPKNWIVDENKAPGFSRVYYIISGDVFYQDEKQSMKLKQGKLYIFPSYSEFKITHNEDNPINCLWLHLDLLPTIINNPIEISVDKNSSLHYLLLSIKSQILKTQGKEPYFLSLVSSLVSYFYENNYIHYPDETLLNILSYINQEYKNLLTIEKISEHFNYTTEHFIRIFQKKVNTTPYQYLTNLRMKEAVQLLSIGTPVKKIALQVGYSDSKIFSHAFKQKFGIPPSKYKFYYRPMA